MSVAFASMSVVGGDGVPNAPISRDREGQSHLLAKPQACEKGVEHAARRDPRSQPGRGRGGLAASDAEGHLIVDVKSSFDVLRKGLAGFRWKKRSRNGDRRRRSLEVGRWVPHPQMPTDGVTKAELLKTKEA